MLSWHAVISCSKRLHSCSIKEFAIDNDIAANLAPSACITGKYDLAQGLDCTHLSAPESAFQASEHVVRRGILSSLSSGMQGTQEQLRDMVLEQYTMLLHDLAASEALALPAGVPYSHRSSAVLVKGTLKVSGRRLGEGKKGSPSLDLEHPVQKAQLIAG